MSSPETVGWRDQIVTNAVTPRAWCPVHAPKAVDHGDVGRVAVSLGEALRVGYRCDTCGEPLVGRSRRGDA